MAPRIFHINDKESKLIIRTRAVGVLARFAHDLEIVASDFSGTATSEGDSWTVQLTVPVASLRVVGARKNDRVDAAALSAKDRADIEGKIRGEVLKGGREVVARAEGSARERGDATVSIGSASARAVASQTLTEGQDGAVTATGRAELSLRALGIAEIKAPLGAFRVSDLVEVVYTLVVMPD